MRVQIMCLIVVEFGITLISHFFGEMMLKVQLSESIMVAEPLVVLQIIINGGSWQASVGPVIIDFEIQF